MMFGISLAQSFIHALTTQTIFPVSEANQNPQDSNTFPLEDKDLLDSLN
jgi:hypothetical protein